MTIDEIQRSTESDRSTGRHLSLMVVDNDCDNATTLRALLRVLGHDAQAFYNGRDAVHALESSKPDAVLLDIGMPEMDGDAVARWIRQQPGLKKVRVIAVSGYDSSAYQERSKAAGCDHYLVKPLDFEELRAVLKSL